MTPLDPQTFISLFREEERAAVEALLLRPRNGSSPNRLDRVIETIPDKPVMQVAPNTGKISHTAHNEMLQGLHTDLLRLFQIYGELDQAIESHNVRTQSLLQDLNNQIDALERRVKYMERWVKRGEGEGAPIEIELESDNGAHATVRDPEFNKAIDESDLLKSVPATRELVLPVISESNRIRQAGGTTTAQLVWIRQDGGYPIEGKERLELALDGRNDTAWWARHISLAPVRDKAATGLEEGVSTTLDLIFESPGPVSELIISPFGPTGIHVISIECYTKEDDPVPNLPLWVGEPGENPEPLRKPFTAIRPFAVYGLNDSVKRIRLKIGQSHYRMRRISRLDLLDPDSLSVKLPPEILEWAEARNIDVPSPNEHELDDEIIVYEYLYGIRSIEAVTRTYKQRGVFISRPIETERQIEQVSIQVNYDKSTSLNSSIRFYVLAHGRAVPIVPKVVNEESNWRVEFYPVTFRGLGVADLPFPIDPNRVDELVLYEEDRIVPPREYIISNNQIAYTRYRTGLKYWVSYYVYPDEEVGGLVVDLTKLGIEPSEQTILFPPDMNKSSSGGRVIELPKEPYIDLRKVVEPGFNPNGAYRPIEVALIGSFPGIETNRITMVNPADLPDPNKPDFPYVANVTDYVGGTRRLLLPYSEDRKIYSFRQEGRKLIFGDPLDGITIEVKYRTLIDHIRIAAVMEQTRSTTLFHSPRLQEILIRPRYISYGV